MKSKVVFVAVDSESGELLGCHFLRPDRRRHCLFGSYLAVALKAQGRGIATRLFKDDRGNLNWLGRMVKRMVG